MSVLGFFSSEFWKEEPDGAAFETWQGATVTIRAGGVWSSECSLYICALYFFIYCPTDENQDRTVSTALSTNWGRVVYQPTTKPTRAPKRNSSIVFLI